MRNGGTSRGIEPGRLSLRCSRQRGFGRDHFGARGGPPDMGRGGRPHQGRGRRPGHGHRRREHGIHRGAEGRGLDQPPDRGRCPPRVLPAVRPPPPDGASESCLFSCRPDRRRNAGMATADIPEDGGHRGDLHDARRSRHEDEGLPAGEDRRIPDGRVRRPAMGEAPLPAAGGRASPASRNGKGARAVHRAGSDPGALGHGNFRSLQPVYQRFGSPGGDSEGDCERKGRRGMKGKGMEEGLTFDDVILLPAESKILPKDVEVSVSLTPEVRLNIPLLSAAMDTVTQADTAIAIAREGGLGVIHRNNTAEEQALEVDKDKNLRGLITIKDILKIKKYPIACKDGKGRLRVGAAIGVGPGWEKRVDMVLRSGAGVLCVDTAHGHSRDVVDVVRAIRNNFREVQLIAGNVATGEGAEAIIKAGADCVKAGVGPGSICTTRVIAGVGVPQVSAIMKCAAVASKRKIPLIADGGIKYSGDITKALAAGASAAMIGSVFAETDESPGEIVLYQGRSYKVYRGMGSLEAMKKGSKDRYFQAHVESEAKLVPEGIEGRVPYRGPLAAMIFQLVGGLKAGMGYVGARSIEDLQKRATFMKVTAAGLKEGHVHDVIITKEAPNYRVE